MARIHAVLLLAAAAVVCFGVEETDAVVGSLDHIVGARLGWAIPPNTTYYDEWANGKTFAVGDKLVFMYTSALQNVMQVSAEDFAACTDKTIINWFYTGPTVLELKESGPHYYFCGVGTHCELGQKLFINVTATAENDPTREGLSPPPAAAAVGEAKSSASSSRAFAGVLAGLVVPSVMLSLLM